METYWGIASNSAFTLGESKHNLEGECLLFTNTVDLSQSICCLLKTRVFLEKNICCKLVYTGCKTSPSDGIFTEIGTLLSLLRLNNRIVHLPINVVKMDFQRVDGAVLEAISTTEPTIHTQFQLLPI